MRVRRAGVHGAVIAGLVALAVSGDSVQPIALGALLLSLVADPLRARLAWLPWSAMLAAALAGAVLFALRGAAPVDVVGLALLALVLHRRLGGVSAADDRVAVLVSGLMLVVAGSRYETPILLAAVALWAVSTPLALLPAALDGLVSRPSASFRRLIAALALSVVAVSASLYPVLPRRSDEQVDPASSRTGFATEVTLGEFDALLDDTSEVVRYTLDPQVDGPLYLRGLALDAFDGTRWSASGGVTATQWQWPEVTPAGAHVLSVQVTDASEGVLFAAGQVRAVDATAAVRVGLDRHGSLRADGRPGPLSYRVLVSAPLGPADVAPRPPGEAPSFRYLDLPDTLEPRIHDLAREVVGAGAPIERARRVEAFLRSDYTYALTGLASDGAAPLDRFLFEDKAGHCQYFASAAAVLLRSEGVPARVVTGFVGGDLDARTGEWVVQNRHAHTWIEVFDGWGWVLIDPTPGPAATTAFPVSEWSVSEAAYGVWSSAVTDYDGAAQLAALGRVGRALARLLPGRPDDVAVGALALFLGVLTLAGAGAPLTRRGLARAAGEVDDRPDGPVARQHARARAQLDRLSVPPALPPVEAAAWVAERAPDAGAPLVELAWLYYEVYLAGAPEAPRVARAHELADRVVRAAGPRATGRE